MKKQFFSSADIIKLDIRGVGCLDSIAKKAKLPEDHELHLPSNKLGKNRRCFERSELADFIVRQFTSNRNEITLDGANEMLNNIPEVVKYPSVGKELRSLCEEFGLKQVELAGIINKTPETISRIINGKFYLSNEKLSTIRQQVEDHFKK